jgi:hypothetical protein
MPSRIIFGLKADKRIPMSKTQKQHFLKQQLQEQIESKKIQKRIEKAQQLEIDKINLEKANIGLSLEHLKQREERIKEM